MSGYVWLRKVFQGKDNKDEKCRWVAEGECTLVNRYPDDTKCNGRFSNDKKYCFCPDKYIGNIDI